VLPSVSIVCTCVRDENLACAYRVVGTHQGPFMGDAPTGKGIAVRGMQIRTFAHGNAGACHPVKGDTGADREVRATDRDAGAAGGGPGGMSSVASPAWLSATALMAPLVHDGWRNPLFPYREARSVCMP